MAQTVRDALCIGYKGNGFQEEIDIQEFVVKANLNTDTIVANDNVIFEIV
jgi:hypothetical protein